MLVDPREHRRHLRGRGRVPPQGHAARGRDAGFGEHAHGRRALRPLRVRPRARPRGASTSRSCTRPTCSRSPATSGSARSTRSRPSTPTSPPAYNHVDAACIYFVQDPGRYDVIVTDNLFGDILTDLGGAIAGGIGRAASANLNPARTGPSLFEPVHGSAPDIAGTGTADPRAAIISAAMMLRVPRRGRRRGPNPERRRQVRRRDGTTAEIGDAIAAADRRADEGSDDADRDDREDLDERRARPVGRGARSTCSRTRCTTASGVFEGIRAYETDRRARRCSGSPTTSSGCSTRRKIMHDGDPVLRRRARRGVQGHRARHRAAESCYVRPIAYFGYGEMGLNTLPCPVDVSIACWPWGAYLGDDAPRPRACA